MGIRRSVTLAAILVTLMVALVLILVARVSHARLEERVTQTITTSKGVIWNQVTHRLFETMEAGIGDFERDFYLKQALKNKDAAALGKAVDGLVNLIGTQGYFDRLYLFDRDRAQLYPGVDTAQRAPEDALSLALASARDGKPRHGVGLDRHGRPVAFLAFELTSRHDPIGTVVFQAPITPALARLKTIDGAEA